MNALEARAIRELLETLVAQEDPPSVGIITPFTDQQRFLVHDLQQSRESEALFARLQLKVMTFDSCQGEERDFIIYSMVASPADNRLGFIFPRDLSQSEDVETVLRLQRLNVGFSRAKECIHFVLSLPESAFGGAIGTAIRHYQQTAIAAENEPTAQDVDPRSPMEANLLHWLKQTDYYREYRSILELVPQFPIGAYLRQMDPTYHHPNYRVDFLLRLTVVDRVHSLIIEYDGFAEHFTNLEAVDASNYRHYYRASDIEREKILESYGYRMLRVNRFNLGRDPVATLSERLYRLTKELLAAVEPHDLVKQNQQAAEGLVAGEMKACPRCGEIKALERFKDLSLKSGMGRVCLECKRK